jgi:hypothetical protein
MSARLPAHLAVSAILRLAEAEGGFGAVLARGEREAGAILLIATCRGGPATLYERMPRRDGSHAFVAVKSQDPEHPEQFADYLARRRRQDPDLWQIEVDIADPERFVAQIADLA